MMNPELNGSISSLIEKRKSQLNLILNWSKLSQQEQKNGNCTESSTTTKSAEMTVLNEVVGDVVDSSSSSLLTPVVVSATPENNPNPPTTTTKTTTTAIDILAPRNVMVDKAETSSLSPSSVDHIDITSSLFDSLNESKSLKLFKKVNVGMASKYKGETKRRFNLGLH